ncbi:hypothetical protein M0811_12620 [Anaeramoeba ignava]|uniref:Uncharacterized protein n=1 Tax=Anaeramoeba ignava TaxID=1746090 RepID=A0A9Q0R5I7_ANAIG|nr:hypothetical protein M0811_12620 [Anaeramoeba ignava]
MNENELNLNQNLNQNQLEISEETKKSIKTISETISSFIENVKKMNQQIETVLRNKDLLEEVALKLENKLKEDEKELN